MKVREFWVRRSTLNATDKGPKGHKDCDDLLHVREVIPIDWEKVWLLADCKYAHEQCIIKALVEKALKGKL